MNNNPHITPQVCERQIRPALNAHGFNDQKIDHVESALAPYLNRADQIDRHAGVYGDELDQTMHYLRAHPDATHFDAHQLDLIDSTLRKHL
ncbi:MAG: hypothetical protein ACREGR_01890 [Minisyncoccia bacterium]